MSVVKTIAKNLGLSPSTVSLVLNNKPGISATTRNKVFEALNEIGNDKFTPRTAQKNKQSVQFVLYKKHGSIVADTPFFANVLEGIEKQVRKYNLNLLISYIYEKNDEGVSVSEQLQTIAETNCIGFILLATEMDISDLPTFQRMGIPFVVLDSYFEDVSIDTVSINNVQGAFMATKYLCDMGHREIGYLSSKIVINNFIERKEGYKKALKQMQLQYNADNVLLISPTLEMAYIDMKQHLEGIVKQRKLPTAFFADNDIIAIGAYKAIREFGFKIPDDISIVGFDDIPMCEMIEPTLTTVRVPKYTIGQIAVDRLANILENNDGIFTKTEVFTELVKRNSVKQC